MFTTINAEKILFTLISTLFALCSFSTVGCGGGAISSVHTEDLRQRVKIAESARDRALKRAENAENATASIESARDRALKRAENAENATASIESARDRALKRAENAENTTASIESARDRALKRAEAAETAKAEAKSELTSTRQSLNRRVKTAEEAKVRAETARDRALRRTETAEKAIAEVKSARDRALRHAETAEEAKVRAETTRDTALRRAKVAEEEWENLQKLVSLVPQATIEKVSVNPKKKSMDISVKFNIKNRKDIEGRVYVYFYFQDEEKLQDEKGNQIVIWKKFTPKSVTETLTVKLPMHYDKLNLGQPDKLMFSVRIHDKPTDRYLNKRHLVSFSYDSSKDNPVWVTDR